MTVINYRGVRITTCAALFMCSVSSANTISVPADQPTIQDGINAATNGDDVLVAPGTYAEIIDLDGKAITVHSSGGAAVTTIDATKVAALPDGKPVVRIDNGEGADTILEGFTLTGGTGDTATFGGQQVGGGIYFGVGVTPMVRQCIIENNTVDTVGGGMFTNNASPTILDCQFIANSAPQNNCGGAYLFGSGAITFERCRFEANLAHGNGGAIFAEGVELTAVDCDFVENTVENIVDARGGAISKGSSGSLELTRCRFLANAAISSNPGGSFPSAGGALVIANLTSTSIDNCLFAGNEADEGGAIWFNLGSSDPFAVVNCTIVGNTATDICGGLYCYDPEPAVFTNCIIWGNADAGGMDSSAQIATGMGQPTVNFSIVQGGWSGPGSNNLDVDPLFVDADGADDTFGTEDDNARLSASSPAIDSGDSIAVAQVGAFDLAGNPRAVDDPATADTGVSVFGITIDRGAYEFGAAQPGTGACCINGACAVVPESSCQSFGGTYAGDGTTCDDITCDSGNCLADIVTSATFQPPPDGLVDGADLAYLLGAWGRCR